MFRDLCRCCPQQWSLTGSLWSTIWQQPGFGKFPWTNSSIKCNPNQVLESPCLFHYLAISFRLSSYIYIYVYIYIYTYMHMLIWRSLVDARPLLLITKFLRQGFSLILELTEWLGRLTSKHWSATGLCYPSHLSPWPWLTSTVIDVSHRDRLLWGCWGLNLSPDASSAGTLRTEPSSQPLHMEFKFCCSLSYKGNYNYIFNLDQRM